MDQLAVHTLNSNATIAHPAGHYVRVSLDDPAASVMTDLRRNRPITIRPNQVVGLAEKLMKAAGVRLLLATQDGLHLEGLVTYRDLNGQKAIAMAASTRVPHDLVTVADVMTPAKDVEAFSLNEVLKIKVRELVTVMRNRARQHALVVDTSDNPEGLICGIFSVTRIGLQLGLNIDASERAQSFAEIERLIAHG